MDPTRTTENSAEKVPSIVIVLCAYHVIPPYRPPFLESSAVASTAVPSSAAASGPRGGLSAAGEIYRNYKEAWFLDHKGEIV